MKLVCESLLEVGYTWEFNIQVNKNRSNIDANLVKVRGAQGEVFYIGFHRAAAEIPKQAGVSFYAIEFIVQKHTQISHLRHFEAISIAYDAIIRRAISATKDFVISEAAQMTVSLVDLDQMHAELLALKDIAFRAEKEILSEHLQETTVS